MGSINRKVNRFTKTTHEGAPAVRQSPYQALRRSLLACMLWENTFYESGEDIATRIMRLSAECPVIKIAELAYIARTEYKLRHAPLLLLLDLVQRAGEFPSVVGAQILLRIDGEMVSFNSVSDVIELVIQRPDEITELLAMYWRDGKKSLPGQLKKGLARAFLKFNEYQLAKYNRPGAVTLRDAMFMVHPKPPKRSEAMFSRLANKQLRAPNTWESRMASGKESKREVFTDLLKNNKLGYMALLRNLRGMDQAGVDHSLIRDALATPSSMILPFRYIAAAKHAPMFERELDRAMVQCLKNHDRLRGVTALLVDVSGSMGNTLSAKSELSRLEAACGLSILLSGICETIRIFTFSEKIVEVPARQGMALSDAVVRSQPHGCTYLGGAVKAVNAQMSYDRLIVMTDEQSHDVVGGPNGTGYMVNVSSHDHAVGYGPWTRITGFSEAIVRFIQELETERQ